MNPSSCRRGEVWMVDFTPGRGSEQEGMRPALVVQNDIGNVHARTTIVAAITTTIKKYPVTVVLDRNEGGLEQESIVNLAQILTLDKSRLMKRSAQFPGTAWLRLMPHFLSALALAIERLVAKQSNRFPSLVTHQS